MPTTLPAIPPEPAPAAEPGPVPASRLAPLWPGLLAGAAALPLAAGVARIHGAWPASPERGVAATLVVFVAIAAATVAVAWLRPGARRRPADLALVAVATTAVLLCASYLYYVSSLLFFHADFLLWTESAFVNDILKFRVGHALYTAPGNLDSFTYPPATQLLTYFLARLAGHGTSIPAYRVVQEAYTAAAAVVAALCCRQLVRAARPERLWRWWSAIWVPVLFLAANNSLTNPYVHYLHDDALALLVCAVGYWLLLEHVEGERRWVLPAMALLPALAFLVKQSLAIWAPLYCLQLAFFDADRSWRRAIGFGAVTFGLLGTTMGGGLLIWGAPWRYWVFTVLGHHPVSPLRSFQHLLDAWPYVVALLIGATVLLQRPGGRRWIGPWLVASALLGVEIYTSGVAWMINHLGPGSLLAAVWLLAGLSVAWPAFAEAEGASAGQRWFRAGAATALVLLAFQGLAMVQIPVPGLPADANRYASAIEAEFQGLPADRVLLDDGSWIYFRQGIVMRDRSAAVGEAGFTGTLDYSGILSRIRSHYYAKILVRDLHSPQFLYDYWMWKHSSGIRQALLDNYREIRVIPEVKAGGYRPPWFRPISVLVPKP